MFRNFSKPAAFERDSMRERHQASQIVSTDLISEQGMSSPLTGSTANDIHSNHAGFPQPSASSGPQKGGYTTSIFVGGKASQQSTVVTHHQTHDDGPKLRQTNGSSAKLPRSVSLSQDNNSRSAQRELEIQKRFSDISLEVGASHSHSNGTNRLPQKHSNGGVTAHTSHANFKSKPNARPDNQISLTHGQSDIEKSQAQERVPERHGHERNVPNGHLTDVLNPRGTPFTQSTFNVIPSPPPLTDVGFAGRRDVRDPTSVKEKQIVSAKGTVRGFKNRVRAGIATFWAQTQDPISASQSGHTRLARNYRLLEQGKIVMYATSMSVVRETSERCKVARSLLQNHMVRYEERDLYMSRDIQQELRDRLSQDGIQELRLPHVFADGIHLGSSEELEKMNEAGELREILNNYQKITVRIMCDKCGGYRFVPCDYCHGSKKSLLRNHFTEEFCALRCMNCDENGLRRCDACIDQQE
ncbi:unnamed protein product [Lymnaea stagnalis]|uniref:Glutaredoxin domain-containing protein n=1 Tax=Lymnaea stagnalis TaxID=6523 RepID=A0AAV2HYU7_LYMST